MKIEDVLALARAGGVECVPWPGFCQPDGYGQTGNGEVAHRAVYLRIVGPIPPGLELDHLCRNRSCVNPNHLEPVTHAENVRRAAALQTHCKHGHEFTPENTRVRRRRGWVERECRACSRATAAAYRLRQKTRSAP